MHGELGWDVRFRALLSTRYVASVIAHDRRCWLEQFTPARIADTEVGRFARERVHVEVADLPTNAATSRSGPRRAPCTHGAGTRPPGMRRTRCRGPTSKGSCETRPGTSLPSDAVARIIDDVRNSMGSPTSARSWRSLRLPAIRPSVA